MCTVSQNSETIAITLYIFKTKMTIIPYKNTHGCIKLNNTDGTLTNPSDSPNQLIQAFRQTKMHEIEKSYNFFCFKGTNLPFKPHTTNQCQKWKSNEKLSKNTSMSKIK